MLIVTDGAVDVPETLLGSGLLRRVPGEIWSGEAPFPGGVDEFWAELRKGHYPSTTPPTVSALVTAYEHPDLVIGLHVSRRLSGTVSRADEAAARAGSGVVVVDTRSLSVGAGLLVTAVHRAAQSPDPPESIIDFAQALPERLHTFALVQDVDSLRRSDRAGLIPSSHLARNHPLVLAVRGRVVALAQPKNRSAAIDELIKHLRRSVDNELGAWALGHGDASDVDAVVDHLSNTLGQPPRFFTALGPTVGTHLGPDALVLGAITGPIEI
jgi:DegV family protein with EDD domain